MKKSTHYLAIVICLSISYSGFAQGIKALKLHPVGTYVPQNKNFEASVFQVENECYIDVEKCVPNSGLDFYSTLHGGRLVNKATVNSEGATRVIVDASKMPSFVLNSKDQIGTTKSGTGYVQHFDEKEFILQNIQFEKKDNQALLTWKAICSERNDIQFEVLRSLDGINFETVHTQTAAKQSNWSSYTFSENFLPIAFYQLRVVKNTTKERYVSNSFSCINTESFCSVYPTLVESTLSIDVVTPQLYSYKITNSLGEVVLQGETENQLSTLNLSQLSNGNYFVTVALSNAPKQTFRIVKG